MTTKTRPQPPGADELNLLARPYPAVEWKVQATNAKPKENPPKKPTKALLVPFIDARAVQARLDYVFGIEWDSEFVTIPGGEKCGITAMGHTRWDAGEESGGPLGSGPKARFSDALKRAAVEWGVGRYLYDLPATWVPCDERSRVSDVEKKRIKARYKAWTQHPATIKLYGEPLGHFREETPADTDEPVDEPVLPGVVPPAPEPTATPEAATAPAEAPEPPKRPDPQPAPPVGPDGIGAPRNVKWPILLRGMYGTGVDPAIQAMACEMAGVDPDDREIGKAQLKLLTPEQCAPLLAILATPAAAGR